jgi:hypothetical protein
MALHAGVPDLNYNFQIVETDETTARVSTRFTGTHTQDLDLTPLGIGVIPATGVAFSAGEEFSEGRVEGGKMFPSILSRVRIQAYSVCSSRLASSCQGAKPEATPNDKTPPHGYPARGFDFMLSCARLGEYSVSAV